MYSILVVDDERLICKGMQKALDQLALFETFVAHSGLMALDIMRERRIDAMLLDISMPDMNGIELMRALSESGRKPLTIVISGYEEFAYAQQALSYGAVEYVLKPVDSEDVAAMGQRLHGMLEQRDRELERNTQVQQMLDELLKQKAQVGQGGEPTAAADANQRVAAQVKRAIEQHYQDDQLSVNRLSELLSYSPNYLGNVFKRAYGLSINDYLGQHRIKEAKRLMDQTDMMIYQIADRVGFSDQNYFSKTFKKYAGVSPSEYRAR